MKGRIMKRRWSREHERGEDVGRDGDAAKHKGKKWRVEGRMKKVEGRKSWWKVRRWRGKDMIWKNKREN